MKMKLSILSALILALLGLVRVATAADYTILFDPATMQVGQTVDEYLVVKDYCPKTTTCTTAERVKYVTATSGRTGRLELPVSLGSDFEISFNIQAPSSCSNELTITLYLSDNSSLTLNISSCYTTRVSYPDGKSDNLNWITGVNDFRLVVAQNVLKISANDTFVNTTFSLSGTINRIVMSKINEGQENLYEIRTRGVQSGGGSIQQGIQQGIAQCKANPASCGITTAATKIDGISTNAFVSPTSKMIAGVLISGGTKRTMVRASSVDGMVDPFVEIYTYPDRQLLGSNDVWASSTAATELTQKKLAPARATDAAMIISLPPGLFTMEVSSRNGGSGASLIEVYDMAVFP